ncbi:MAG: T9SS type A sorting domain-containing protein, partial [Bacteroidota bacterium]
PQVISFDSVGTFGPNFAYVVTDNNGTILGLPPGDMVNFQPAGPGECWVWGLSYTGTVTAQVGDNATQVALSDGCFDLSDNFLVVFRDSVSGGDMITDAMGNDTVQVCLDGMPQVVSFDSVGAVGPNFAYVVTDNNGTILGLPPGDMVNFQPAGPGECWVWGLSYTGNVTAQVGDNATQVALSDGCFDLSDNFLVVFRDSVSGGNITDEMGNDSVFVCIDGTDQFVSFDSSNVVGPNFAYVITDDQGTILGLPPGDMANFAPAGPGICYVWGLSYTGNIIAMMGQNALQVPLTDGCFDLSDDFLVVARDSSNCTTSIEDELPLGSVNIYPNPVQDLVTIELSQAIRSEVALLTIHDLTGREIYRAEWESIQDRQNVDTHKWDSGLYILTLQTDAGVFRSKIVKE